MKKILIFILFLVSAVGFGQDGEFRNIEVTNSLTLKDSTVTGFSSGFIPDTNKVLYYISRAIDTITVDSSVYSSYSDSSNVADTALYALNIPINSFIDTIYNNSYDSILIADTLLHYRADIDFTLIRNNVSTFGDIYINQINDSKISYFWYNNNLVNSLLFEKVIWDNDIYIKMTDLLVNGNDTRIIFNVNYKLK